MLYGHQFHLPIFWCQVRRDRGLSSRLSSPFNLRCTRNSCLRPKHVLHLHLISTPLFLTRISVRWRDDAAVSHDSTAITTDSLHSASEFHALVYSPGIPWSETVKGRSYYSYVNENANLFCDHNTLRARTNYLPLPLCSCVPSPREYQRNMAK